MALPHQTFKMSPKIQLEIKPYDMASDSPFW